MSNETKHTRGELAVRLDEIRFPQIVTESGVHVASLTFLGSGPNGVANKALEIAGNAKRLCAGWNLLNRLEEMGVTPEQVIATVEASKQSVDMLANANIISIESVAGDVEHILSEALTKKD